MISKGELRKISMEVFKVLEDTTRSLMDKFDFSDNIERKLYIFHRILDTKAMEALLSYFSGFYWMDHWFLKKVGKSPEIFVVMNSSDGTERVARRIIGGHVISMAFLPPESRKIGDTIFSGVWAYEVRKYALAFWDGEVELFGFKRGLEAKGLEDAFFSIEFGDDSEREKILLMLNEILKRAGKILKPGCFSLNMLHVALSNLHFHIDLRENSADVSHYPPLYLFFKNLGGCWKVYEKEWKDVSDLLLEPRKKVKMVAASNEKLCTELLNFIKF